MLVRHPVELAYFWTMVKENETHLSRSPIDESQQYELAEGLLSIGAMRDRFYMADYHLIDMSAARNRLLTSDRPISISGDMRKLGGVLMMPVGPTELFVAVGLSQTFNNLFAHTTVKRLAEIMNRSVVSHAEKFVYADDARQSVFIKKHFGTDRRHFLKTLLMNDRERRNAITAPPNMESPG